MPSFREGYRGGVEPKRIIYDPDYGHAQVVSQHPDDQQGGLSPGDRIKYSDECPEHLRGREGTVIGAGGDGSVYTELDDGEIHKASGKYVPEKYVRVDTDESRFYVQHPHVSGEYAVIDRDASSLVGVSDGPGARSLSDGLNAATDPAIGWAARSDAIKQIHPDQMYRAVEHLGVLFREQAAELARQ